MNTRGNKRIREMFGLPVNGKNDYLKRPSKFSQYFHRNVQLDDQQTDSDSSTTSLSLPSAKKAKSKPRIFDGTFYEILKEEGGNVEARCLECLETKKGNMSSTGNFLGHIRTKHPSLAEKLKNHLEQKHNQSAGGGGGVQRAVAILGPAVSKTQVIYAIQCYSHHSHRFVLIV